MKSSVIRTRWAAIGAAVAVSLGAGGFGLADAAISSGEKPVTITTETERVLDTRVNLGLSGRFADATPRELTVTGVVDVAPSGTKTVVPTDAVGVLVNVTVVAPSHNGFLSLRPGGATGKPETSTVNFQPGGVYPNAATVDLGPGGTVQIWVETSSDSGNAHVLLDIVGYTVDHTHDDRYYTKSQVNGKVADAKTLAVFSSGDQNTTLTGTDATIESVSLTAPSAGTVIVNSSTDFDQTGSGAMGGRCSITTGTTHDFGHLQISYVADGQQQTVSGTRGFDVGAGAFTVRLVCDVFTGTGSARDSSLTAMFVPD